MGRASILAMTLRVVSLVFSALLLAAVPARGQDLRADPATLARLVPGKTTAQETRALLGQPDRVMRSRVHGGEEWSYPFRRGYDWRVLWVVFTPEGLVREASEQPDYDRDPRFRGG